MKEPLYTTLLSLFLLLVSLAVIVCAHDKTSQTIRLEYLDTKSRDCLQLEHSPYKPWDRKTSIDAGEWIYYAFDILNTTSFTVKSAEYVGLELPAATGYMELYLIGDLINSEEELEIYRSMTVEDREVFLEHRLPSPQKHSKFSKCGPNVLTNACRVYYEDPLSGGKKDWNRVFVVGVRGMDFSKKSNSYQTVTDSVAGNDASSLCTLRRIWNRVHIAIIVAGVLSCFVITLLCLAGLLSIVTAIVRRVKHKRTRESFYKTLFEEQEL